MVYELPGPPNGAGFEHGQENTYFRIGLVLAFQKVVFPDLGLLKQLFIVRETFINRGNGLKGTLPLEDSNRPFLEVRLGVYVCAWGLLGRCSMINRICVLHSLCHAAG